MSDDIVERLRDEAKLEVRLSDSTRMMIDDAAAEIERLRDEIAGYKENEIQLESRIEADAAKIERLRARVAELEARHLAGGSSHVAGCACPPGANLACSAAMCPRKTPRWTT